MLTYVEMQQAMAQARASSVLLGNGFSRACSDEAFRYSTLFNAANFGPRTELIRQAFGELETEDFEKVTARMRAAADLLRVYGQSDELREQLLADAETIKGALVAAIAHTHPARPGEIADNEYESTRRFLADFNRIYTVNYDLLMYWARNQEDLDPQNWSTDDGFRRNQCWMGPETDQDIFFLHGALHLYQHETGVKKRAFSNEGTAIIDVVRRALRSDIFPLFVSEPTSALKLERINSNPYLSYCLRRLSQETGSLLVYGHSFADVDAHILKAVYSSGASQVFVSLFGDPESDDNRRIRASALGYLDRRGRVIEFVDASTLPAWQDL